MCGCRMWRLKRKLGEWSCNHNHPHPRRTNPVIPHKAEQSFGGLTTCLGMFVSYFTVKFLFPKAILKKITDNDVK